MIVCEDSYYVNWFVCIISNWLIKKNKIISIFLKFKMFFNYFIYLYNSKNVRIKKEKEKIIYFLFIYWFLIGNSKKID